MAAKHTLAELQAHLLYKGLTDKQKRFVDSYIASGDKATAVRAGYGEMSEESVKRMGYACLNAPSIRKLLTYYYGQDMGGGAMNRSELLMLISARLRDDATKAPDFCKLAEMLIELKFQGGTVAVSEDENEPSSIDELVKKLEGK